MIKITEKDFKEYEKIRSSGKTNMFAVNVVVMLSEQLNREKCLEIMKNYDKYCKQYPNIRK